MNVCEKREVVQTLDRLLSPLGFRMAVEGWYFKGQDGELVRIEDEAFPSAFVCGVNEYGQHITLAFRDLRVLVETLGKIGLFFVAGSVVDGRWTLIDKETKNPYFGCKSLEEMLITKDLLRVGEREGEGGEERSGRKEECGAREA